MTQLQWIEKHAGPDCKRFQANIGWLEIDLWAPSRGNPYFYCKPLGFNQQSTGQADIDAAKQLIELLVVSRIKEVAALVQFVADSPVTTHKPPFNPNVIKDVTEAMLIETAGRYL